MNLSVCKRLPLPAYPETAETSTSKRAYVAKSPARRVSCKAMSTTATYASLGLSEVGSGKATVVVRSDFGVDITNANRAHFA